MIISAVIFPIASWSIYIVGYRNPILKQLSTIIIGTLCLTALIVVIIYFYQKWYFETYFYNLTDFHIVIRKSPLTPREITIPYERIQDVYVDQDLLDRVFGLYDVHLSSATSTSGLEAHIDGVEKSAADGLRTELLQKIQEKKRG